MEGVRDCNFMPAKLKLLHLPPMRHSEEYLIGDFGQENGNLIGDSKSDLIQSNRKKIVEFIEEKRDAFIKNIVENSFFIDLNDTLSEEFKKINSILEESFIPIYWKKELFVEKSKSKQVTNYPEEIRQRESKIGNSQSEIEELQSNSESEIERLKSNLQSKIVRLQSEKQRLQSEIEKLKERQAQPTPQEQEVEVLKQELQTRIAKLTQEIKLQEQQAQQQALEQELQTQIEPTPEIESQGGSYSRLISSPKSKRSKKQKKTQQINKKTTKVKNYCSLKRNRMN